MGMGDRRDDFRLLLGKALSPRRRIPFLGRGQFAEDQCSRNVHRVWVPEGLAGIGRGREGMGCGRVLITVMK